MMLQARVGARLLRQVVSPRMGAMERMTAKPSAMAMWVPSRSMAVVPFKLADIGEGIAEVELMKWFVKAGDSVKSFDRICEVQSDKATVEITSRFDGKIVSVHHKEGDIVKVGAALVDIETSAAGAGADTSKKATSPAAIPAAKPATGAAPHAAAHVAASPSAVELSLEKVLTTPAVRKIAKENNLDLRTVRGTGPKGRVLKEDVLSILSGKTAPAAGHATPAAVGAKVAPAIAPVAPISAVDQKVPIRGVQRLMVKSMNAARQVQHLTLCEEINFDNMKQLRKELKGALKDKGIKLSYMPFIIKATSLALLKFPQLNATVDAEVTEMTHHANHNIGIAMDTPKGLIVPVLKQVQLKSLVEIAIELGQLQEAAVNGTITESQLSGGTFSLSNIGSVGGTYAVPVVVVPQVMIGAFGRLQTVPRYVNAASKPANDEEIEDGEAEVRPTTIMNVSWSADHRVIDGATVGKFSNVWKSYLEKPHLMLSQMR